MSERRQQRTLYTCSGSYFALRFRFSDPRGNIDERELSVHERLVKMLSKPEFPLMEPREHIYRNLPALELPERKVFSLTMSSIVTSLPIDVSNALPLIRAKKACLPRIEMREKVGCRGSNVVRLRLVTSDRDSLKQISDRYDSADVLENLSDGVLPPFAMPIYLS